MLVLAATIGSSLVQPLFGALSDRLTLPWLMPVGVAVAGDRHRARPASCPRSRSPSPSIAISGLGVAAFHPEGARYANYASGARRGTGMSLFSVGGNVGFALGPILVTARRAPARPAAARCCWSSCRPSPGPCWPSSSPTSTRRRRGRDRGRRGRAARDHEAAVDRWGPFTRLGGVIALRSGVYFGLQSFVPLWFVHQLGATEAAGQRGADRDARGRRGRARSSAAGWWTGSGAGRCCSARSRCSCRCCVAFVLVGTRARGRAARRASAS